MEPARKEVQCLPLPLRLNIYAAAEVSAMASVMPWGPNPPPHPIQAACSLLTRAQHTLKPHHTNRKRHLRRARHAPPLRRRGPRPVAACSPRSIWRKQVVRCGNASGAGQNADRFCHDVSNSELRGEGRAEGRGAQGRSGEGARGERCCRAVRSHREGRRGGGQAGQRGGE